MGVFITFVIFSILSPRGERPLLSLVLYWYLPKPNKLNEVSYAKLGRFKVCLALERYQTMTAAARALGTNTATVSRRIDRLTEEAGEPLFLRDNT